MAKINSRYKGTRNERQIAEIFTKWTKRKFAKTPASGGLNWKSAFSKGDIVCTKEGHYFPFCIEAKSYEKIDFSHLLTPGIKNIDILKFWEQCERDAKKCNKIPILMMRYNGLPKGFYFLVVDMNFAMFLKLRLLEKHPIGPQLLYYPSESSKRLTIMRSTDFFKLDYKETKILAKQYIKDGTK